jgi:hypothetical protein
LIKPTGNIIFKSERQNPFSLRSGIGQDCLLIFLIVIEVLACGVRKENKLKDSSEKTKKKCPYLQITRLSMYKILRNLQKSLVISNVAQ